MAVIAALPFCLVGLALALYSCVCAVQAAASTRWPRTEGVIVEANMRRARGIDGGVLQGQDVRYRFHDGTRHRIGSRIYYGDALLSTLSRPAYRVGQRVEISYEPSTEDCVLRPGMQRELLASLGLGLVLTILGAIAYWVL